jgi:hypothetical protein
LLEHFCGLRFRVKGAAMAPLAGDGSWTAIFPRPGFCRFQQQEVSGRPRQARSGAKQRICHGGLQADIRKASRGHRLLARAAGHLLSRVARAYSSFELWQREENSRNRELVTGHGLVH